MCNNKGYKGRTAIHEIMPVTENIKRCVHNNDSVVDVRNEAIKEGMITLDENMKRIVLEGTTSINELIEMNSFQM
jgi:type IV pilus assembly protein PilB